ncbi:MAG: tol-pal system protein YbgF [Gemmatimonadota bacterium]
MKSISSLTAVRVLAALAAVVTASGCATKGDIRDLRTELRDLALRQDSLIVELRRASRSTQDTLRETSDQLFSFRGEIARQLGEISDALATLEALAGENQRGIAGIRDQLANMRRLPASGGGGPAGLGPPGGEGAGDTAAAGRPVSGEAVPGPVGDDAEQLYNSAVGLFNRGSLATARLAFQQFLQSHPGHRLAPDAQFLLADILSQEGRPEDALEAFLQVPELYPTAAKVPDALYRAALLQIELERMDDARATLQRIVNTYPGTVAASLASEKLDEIG